MDERIMMSIVSEKGFDKIHLRQKHYYELYK